MIMIIIKIVVSHILIWKLFLLWLYNMTTTGTAAVIKNSYFYCYIHVGIHKNYVTATGLVCSYFQLCVSCVNVGNNQMASYMYNILYKCINSICREQLAAQLKVQSMQRSSLGKFISCEIPFGMIRTESKCMSSNCCVYGYNLAVYYVLKTAHAIIRLLMLYKIDNSWLYLLFVIHQNTLGNS